MKKKKLSAVANRKEFFMKASAVANRLRTRSHFFRPWRCFSDKRSSSLTYLAGDSTLTRLVMNINQIWSNESSVASAKAFIAYSINEKSYLSSLQLNALFSSFASFKWSTWSSTRLFLTSKLSRQRGEFPSTTGLVTRKSKVRAVQASSSEIPFDLSAGAFYFPTLQTSRRFVRPSLAALPFIRASSQSAMWKS